MVNAVDRGPDWAGLPVIATVTSPLCRTGRTRDGTPLTDRKPTG